MISFDETKFVDELPRRALSKPPGKACRQARPAASDFPNETRAAAHLLFLTGWEPGRVANALSIRDGLARRWKAEADAAFAAVLGDGVRPVQAGR